MTSTQGELVTEKFEHDGGRQVTVYVPPEKAEAIVFAGDSRILAGSRAVSWCRVSSNDTRHHKTVDARRMPEPMAHRNDER